MRIFKNSAYELQNVIVRFTEKKFYIVSARPSRLAKLRPTLAIIASLICYYFGEVPFSNPTCHVSLENPRLDRARKNTFLRAAAASSTRSSHIFVREIARVCVCVFVCFHSEGWTWFPAIVVVGVFAVASPPSWHQLNDNYTSYYLTLAGIYLEPAHPVPTVRPRAEGGGDPSSSQPRLWRCTHAGALCSSAGRYYPGCVALKACTATTRATKAKYAHDCWREKKYLN